MKIFISLFSICFLSYYYVINGDFIGDDVGRILFNPELFSFKDAIFGDLGDRPLLMFFMTALNKLFGMNVIAFRIFSIFIHSLVGYQLYKFILELNDSKDAHIANTVSFSLAALFCCHPLNNQVITTAIQAGVLLSGLFGLLTLRYFNQSDNSKVSLIKIYFFYFLGVISKSNIIFIPFSIFFSEKFKGIKEKKKLLLGFLIISIIPAIYYLFFNKNVQQYTVGFLKYFLVQNEVLFVYFKLILFPKNLQFLYDFNVPKDVFFNINWLLFLAHIFLIFIVIKYLKSAKLKWIFISFYLSFVPESSFFPIQHLAFEHRTYFALIFFTLFWGVLFADKVNKANLKFFRFSVLTVGVIYLFLNQERNLDVKRYRDWALANLQHSSQYSFNNYQFTYLLMRAGNIEEVRPYIEKYELEFKSESYDVLRDMLYYFEKKYDKEYITNLFFKRLQEDSLTTNARFFVNKFMLEEIAHKSIDFSLLSNLEKTLALQLRIFFKNKQMFKSIISNYFSLVEFLNRPEMIDKFKLDEVNFLKSKVLVCYYFDKKCDGLALELDTQLGKNPDSKLLKRLDELLRQKGDGKFE